MTHTPASADLLGRQLQAHIITLPGLLARAQNLADDLIREDRTQYTIDHAEEHLQHIADALEYVTERLRNLQTYTVTGAARAAERDRAMARALIAAGSKAITEIGHLPFEDEPFTREG